MQKETIFSCEWVQIESQDWGGDVRALNGKPFYKLLLPDGVMILPVTRDSQFVLIKQFRPAIERSTIEVPSGAISPDESARDTAIRELYEETGYRCEEYVCVGGGVVRMDREDAQNSYYIGMNAELDPDFEATEDIEVVLVDATDFPKMVMSGEFDHIAALPVLLLAQWKLGIDLVRGMSSEISQTHCVE